MATQSLIPGKICWFFKMRGVRKHGRNAEYLTFFTPRCSISKKPKRTHMWGFWNCGPAVFRENLVMGLMEGLAKFSFRALRLPEQVEKASWRPSEREENSPKIRKLREDKPGKWNLKECLGNEEKQKQNHAVHRRGRSTKSQREFMQLWSSSLSAGEAPPYKGRSHEPADFLPKSYF